MTALYALKFISGKYQGGEFPLPEKGEIVVGRGAEVAMVLVEDMVSRKHARIVLDGKRMGIVDLGSTNGTFVNGEKVGKQELKIGDRVLIGTNILKVIELGALSTQNASLTGDELRLMLEEIALAHGGDTTMSGELEEVPFPDLLQLFSSSKKSGMLEISGAHEGTVFLKEGQVVFAEVSHQKMDPLKAFGRMVQWKDGKFELKALGELKFPNQITQSTESILLEALRQLDEISRVMQHMPLSDDRLMLARPPRTALKELSPEELDMVQLFLGAATYNDALDNYPGTDFDAMKALKALFDKGVLALD